MGIHIGKLSLGQLFSADEAFFCGTASEVTPICEVDGRTIGNGKLGLLTKKMQEIYIDIVHGKTNTYKHWLTFIEESEEKNNSVTFQERSVTE